MCNRKILEHFLNQCRKINSKWIIGLHIRPKIIKFLENKGRTLFDINYSNIILISLLIEEIKAKIFNGTKLNLKDFAQQRKLLTKGRDHLLNKRKYL